MSIAVRVSVWILGVLVVVSAAIAVMTLMQKQTLQGQNQNLRSQISDDEGRLADLTAKAKKLEDDETALNNQISQTQQEKAQLQSQYDDLKQRAQDVQAQLDQANSDRDNWKSRVDTISRERDDLMQKLKNQPVKIVYKDRPIQVPTAAGTAVVGGNTPGFVDVTSTANQSEQYWAGVLRQKAALQIEVQKEKADLDQAVLQVGEFKRENSDLETQLKGLSNDKDEIVQKIKYGQDLADNLSIDLARARDDQQVTQERADKLKEENEGLLSQIRELNSNKIELERTISNLTDDKDAMQKKLIETQTVIQSRIDDIWKIKESLDKKLSENSPSGGGMDLPPIIVNAPAQQLADVVGKTEGSIISINDPDNFVIVDLGQQNSDVSVGKTLKVYRDSNQIGSLEIIQVRKDICAADIKDNSVRLKVGDTVKFN